jgi:DNA repair exonuclease SbcCD ATPase subunit
MNRSGNSLSELLKSENDSILDQINWSKNEKLHVLQELREKFEKQKSKLNILSMKGLEKTAFVGKQKAESEDEKIKVITKVQNYMKDSIGKVEQIFKESLDLLKFAQLREEELKNKIKEKEKQNKFWEKTNEDIEQKMTEIDLQKLDLEKQLNQMEKQKQKAENELNKRENDLIQRERELFEKENEIYQLNNNMRQSSFNLQLMEDQKSMAEQIKTLTQDELKRVEEENEVMEFNTGVKINELQDQKKKLEKELESMKQSKVELEKELKKEQERNKLIVELGMLLFI